MVLLLLLVMMIVVDARCDEIHSSNYPRAISGAGSWMLLLSSTMRSIFFHALYIPIFFF